MGFGIRSSKYGLGLIPCTLARLPAGKDPNQCAKPGFGPSSGPHLGRNGSRDKLLRSKCSGLSCTLGVVPLGSGGPFNEPHGGLRDILELYWGTLLRGTALPKFGDFGGGLL